MLLKPLTDQTGNQANTFSGGVLRPLTGPSAVQMPQAYQKPTISTPTIQTEPKQKKNIFTKTSDLFKKVTSKIGPKKYATQKLDNGLTIDLVDRKTELKVEGSGAGRLKLDEPKIAGSSAQLSAYGQRRYSPEGQAEIMQKNQAKIQSAVRPIRPDYVEPKTFGQAIEAIKQGSVSLVASLGATSEMIGQMTGHILLTEIGQKLNTEAQKIIARNPEWNPPEDQKWGTAKVARLVAGAVPSLLATIGAGVFGKIASFSVGFSGEAGGTYQEAKEAGVPEGKAQIYGTTVGIVNGVLETIFPEDLLTPATKTAKKKIAKKFARRLVDMAFDFGVKFTKNGALEGTTEALQELVSNAVATQYDEDRKLWDGLLESYVGGFGSGGIAGQFKGETSIAPGEYTPEQVRNKVINSQMENTKDGKEIIKATFEAEKRGQNIKIASEEEQALERVKNLNRSLNEKNTAQVKEDTLAGKREDKRIDNEKTLKQFKLYNQAYNKPGVTIDTKVKIYRAGAKMIQAGDHVTVSKANASNYIDQRIGAKLFEKEVQIKDLVFSEGKKNEQIYAPKEEVVKGVIPEVKLPQTKGKVGLREGIENQANPPTNPMEAVYWWQNKLRQAEDLVDQADNPTSRGIKNNMELGLKQAMAKFRSLSPDEVTKYNTEFGKANLPQTKETVTKKQPKNKLKTKAKKKTINQLQKDEEVALEAFQDAKEKNLPAGELLKELTGIRKEIRDLRKMEDDIKKSEMFKKQRDADVELRKTDPSIDKVTKTDEKILIDEALKYNTLDEFIQKMRGSATQYGEYLPKLRRFVLPESKRLHEMTDLGPNDTITVYRGIDNAKATPRINNGDFVTTDPADAEQYIGTDGQIVEKETKAKNLINEYPDEEVDDNTFYELIYQTKPVVKITDTKLIEIYNQAKGIKTKEVVKKEPTVTTKESMTSPEAPKQTIKTKMYKDKATAIEVNTAKNVRQVKSALKKISNEFNDMIAESEGIAEIAKQQREGLNTDDIAKLKRLVATTKAFQEGDIETIRASKWASLVNNVIEDVQENNPGMSEQEAFDFAMELPTKAGEKPVKTEAIKKLEKRQKILEDYLKVLNQQLDLENLRKQDEGYTEWQEALAKQEKLIKATEAVGEYLKPAQKPIGTGKSKESRAYKRIAERYGSELANQDVTYNQMSVNDQARKASSLIEQDQDKATMVALGLVDPPVGLDDRAVAIAVADKALAEGNMKLWNEVEGSSSLRQTRKGQSIVLDRGRFDQNDPHTYLSRVLSDRLLALGNKLKSKDSIVKAFQKENDRKPSPKEAVVETIKQKAEQISKEIKRERSKINNAQKLIDSLICK